MKVSRNLFSVIAAMLIIMAIVGPLDQKARTFIKGANEKTIKFHSIVSDVKLVLSGLSKINIPFISGHTDDLTESLSKAKDYLLKISAIVFSQLMLLSISQTLMFKILLLVLFALHLLKKTSSLSAKFLIMLLALNPGLSIYSSGIDYISQKSAIHYGDAYLAKLEAQVSSIKSENAQLMAQHHQQQAQIKNGEKHVSIFGKLKEDVSYDFKKVGNDVKGDFTEIRLLIKEAGHEMTMKVYNFCTMILFSFLLLPLGYVLLVYVLYKNTFHSVSVVIQDSKQLLDDTEQTVQKAPLFQRVKKALTAAWTELRSIPEKIEEGVEHGVEDVEHGVEDVQHAAKAEIAHVHQKLLDKIEQLESNVKNGLADNEQKLQAFAENIKTDASNAVDKVKEDAKALVSKDVADIEHVPEELSHDAVQAKDNVQAFAENIKTDASNAVDKVKEDAKALVGKDVADIEHVPEELSHDAVQAKDNVQAKLSAEKTKLIDDANNLRTAVDDKVLTAKQKIGQDAADVKEAIHTTLDQGKTDLWNQAHAIDQHISSSVDAVEHVAHNLKNKEEEIRTTITQDIQQTIDNTKDGITTAIDEGKTDLWNQAHAIGQHISSSVEAVENVAHDLKNKEEDIKSTITQGVQHTIDNVKGGIHKEEEKIVLEAGEKALSDAAKKEMEALKKDSDDKNKPLISF